MEEFLNSITINDFKEEFKTAFKYLPVWELDIYYFPQDKVYYLNTKRFYEAILENENIPPTDITKWKVVQDNILLYVSDNTIEQALDKAKNKLKTNACFSKLINNQRKEVLLQLTAHYVYENVSGDLTGNSGGLIETSTSVGNVSQSFTAPKWILESKTYSLYSHTPFGVRYATLMSTLCGLQIGVFKTNQRC
jgi:hypothetical protein